MVPNGFTGVDVLGMGAMGVDATGAVFEVVLQASIELRLFMGAFVLVGLVLVYDGFRRWQRMRLMQDTPTERIRSAAVGRTELSGVGHPIGDPLRRPFDDGTCLVATWEIEEWEETRDENGRRTGGNWSTVDSGTLFGPFQLDDGTGTLRVEPDEDTRFKFHDDNVTEIRVKPRHQEPPEVADFLRYHTDVDVPPSGGITGFLFSEDRKYTQRYIPVGADLYLLGGTEPTDPDEHNSSGLVFRRDSGSGAFVVSDLTEAELVSGARWVSPLEALFGLAVSTVALFFLLSSTGVA